jgi:RND family efflux transporter MFP subunit
VTFAVKLFRILVTLLLAAAAIAAGRAGWRHYMESPWTRDARVKADVVTIGADVPGIVTEVRVRDNQLVHKGDVLFVVDDTRYASALASADAALAAQGVEKTRRGSEARRRAALDTDIVSQESRAAPAFAENAASAQYRAALTARELAKLNLERTVVRAPVTGYVTNLHVYVGDFAAVGAPKLALIDSASFYVMGYFEETRLPLLKAGAPVDVRLMDGVALRGHVESVARGITDRDATTGRELLADVNPTFNWVRLAQRIPVRVAIDRVPAGVRLVAGQTATVKVLPGQHGKGQA